VYLLRSTPCFEWQVINRATLSTWAWREKEKNTPSLGRKVKWRHLQAISICILLSVTPSNKITLPEILPAFSFWPPSTCTLEHCLWSHFSPAKRWQSQFSSATLSSLFGLYWREMSNTNLNQFSFDCRRHFPSPPKPRLCSSTVWGPRAAS